MKNVVFLAFLSSLFTFTSTAQTALYEMDLSMTGMAEYGISFNEIMEGQVSIPAEGARFDVSFEGTINGPKLKGKVVGVDYLSMRADGRTNLNVYLKITTEDGQNIFAQIGGNATPRPNTKIIDLRENGTLFTSSEEYKWVNGLQVWAKGTVDRATGKIRLAAFSE